MAVMAGAAVGGGGGASAATVKTKISLAELKKVYIWIQADISPIGSVTTRSPAPTPIPGQLECIFGSGPQLESIRYLRGTLRAG